MQEKSSTTLVSPENWSNLESDTLKRYRLNRVQEQLRSCDCAGAVLYDSINIRYATGTSYMPVFGMHMEGRYCFVPAEGKVTLFDKPHMLHLWSADNLIGEMRPVVAWREMIAGPDVEVNVTRWTKEIYDFLIASGGTNKKLAIDRCEPSAAFALQKLGIEIIDAQVPLEKARAIKSQEEVECMNAAISVAEIGMQRMHENLEPGMTENELWSILAQTNTEYGGDWLECRLLSSGERTNPWLQETSNKIISSGELVAFDTDMVGPFGYCADISRTYLCGSGEPSPEQCKLYRLAYEELHHNIELMQPGKTFREIVENAWRVPEIYAANSYAFVAHGVGMCDEWPNVYPLDRLERQKQTEVQLEPGMVMCVESYIGEAGGKEGVKLEDQVLITNDGYELLSTFPFEESLLSSEI